MSPGSPFSLSAQQIPWLAYSHHPRLISCHRHALHRLADPIEKGKAHQPRTPPYPLLPTLFSLPSSPYSLLPTSYSTEAHCIFQGKREEGREGSAWPLCSGLPLWIARRSCRARRAQARQPRTTLSSLLSTPYFPHMIEGAVSVSDMRVVP